LLNTKALATGRGSNAFSPNAADGKLMMEIDQRGIGGFDGVLAQKLAGHMLEHIHSRHQSELPVQIVQDTNWHILVSIKKAPVLMEHAQLERKTPAVVVAAAALHFRAVGLG
jgi:hypothetical protein